MYSRVAAVLAAVVLIPLAVAAPASAATTDPPTDLPAGVPAAALAHEPALPTPDAQAWPFPETWSRTSGTGRLDAGASYWTDFLYDDHGAALPLGLPTDLTSSLAPTQGSFSYPDGPASGNGADIFRTAVAHDGDSSYWRVDWNTLVDPDVPIAEWALDTDGSPSTGTDAWTAGAGLTSPGIEQTLVVSSRGAALVDPVTGQRTDVVAGGGALAVDTDSRSFVVRVPDALLPTSGEWTVRMAAGLANAAGTGFQAPTLLPGLPLPRPGAAAYNVAFRSTEQEPPVYTDGMTDQLIAQAGPVLAAGPLGDLGLDGLTRFITGNFWNEDHQADALATGDVSDFSLPVDWSDLAADDSTPEPAPTGTSTRWYVTTLDLGQGVVGNTSPAGDLAPNYLGRVQPYTVYVPTSYDESDPAPLTWILHSLGVNHNQYAALNPQLLQELCEDRGSICATTLGFGPDGWYFDEAEVDFWQVWRQLAGTYSLDTERTAISGYSMGGWAAYKLGLAHPDLFATALSLEGPPSCGVEVVPGLRLPADALTGGSGRCGADGEAAPVLGNARWLPYSITAGVIDELVPVTSTLALIKDLDDRGYRYHAEVYPLEDHLVYATQDRFGAIAGQLGTPTRTKNPGHISYSWFPDVDVPELGIGTTTAYWLSDLQARDTAPGALSKVDAVSAAIPDPDITVQRTGPSLQNSPTPAGVFDLSWDRGDTPPAEQRVTLDLTGVSALTVDTDRAGLSCPEIVATTDGPTTLTLTGDSGTRVVPLSAGSSTVQSCQGTDAGGLGASGGGTTTGAATDAGSGSGAAGGSDVDAAAVRQSLARTGGGAALPIAAALLVGVGGLALHRRRRMG